jgi:hypothetical protein
LISSCPSGEACDQPRPNWIAGDRRDDGNGARRSMARTLRAPEPIPSRPESAGGASRGLRQEHAETSTQAEAGLVRACLRPLRSARAS